MRKITDQQLNDIRKYSAIDVSDKKISDLIGIHEETVRRYRKILDLPRQQRKGMRRGPRHHAWTSGRCVDRDGYILISCGPEHPHIRKLPGRIVGRILEHRIFAEIKLGRLLLPSEVVDHIDGHRMHNDPDNLRVFESNSDHLRNTITGQVPQWSSDGRAKLRLARHYPERAASEFPEQIDTYNQHKKRGDVRKQRILLAHESNEVPLIWFLGMKRYFDEIGIDWPFDQKTEDNLKKKYLQMILHHPMLKLWIQG